MATTTETPAALIDGALDELKAADSGTRAHADRPRL